MNAGKTGILSALLVLLLLGQAMGRTMNVQVRDAVLRERPSFMGAITGQVAYGDQVHVTQEQGAWRLVQAETLEGWLHASALTTKTIKRPVDGRTVGTTASASEIALAGKGFNQQVEDQFRQSQEQADYAPVDHMQTLRVSESEIRAFIKQGQLRGDAL